MDTDRLKQFCVVVESPTLTRASELLRMSPSALSRAMTALQNEVGERLFLTEGRRLRINEPGQRFYRRARRLLEDWEASVRELRALPERRPAIAIGSFEIFSTRLLAAAVARELVPGTMEQALLKGEIDYFLTYVPMPQAGIDLLPLATFQPRVFAAPGAFRGQPLAEVPFAVPITPIGSNLAGLPTLDGWPVQEPRRVRYRVELLETAIQLARRGLCAVYLPQFVAKLANAEARENSRLAELPAAARLRSPAIRILLGKRATRDEDRVDRRLARAIRTLTAD